MYLLDTHIVSYWMRGNVDLINRIKMHAPSDLAFSAITLAEILYGIQKSPVRKRERRIKLRSISAQLKIYAFDEAAAQSYALIRTQLEEQGLPMSERDSQIAAIAMAKKLVVVTYNGREFGRIAKLNVEDWASD